MAIMQRLDEFRIYYNHTIHPELLRLERRRKRLLWFLFASVLLIIAILLLEVYINIFSITFLLMILIGFYIVYLLYAIRQFVINFKPRVVNLILDFIDDGVNFGTLQYSPKKKIDKKTFLNSKIFVTKAPQYTGEDFIKGKIGTLDFQLSELNVREYSKVRNRLNYVFRGIFLHSQFHTSIRGAMLILPVEFKQYLSRTVKAFAKQGGALVEEEIHNPLFEEHFTTYATPDVFIQGILSPDMQDAVVDYKIKTGKELYISFVDNDIYLAITEPKDILEPFIFQSNVSFDLVKEFFEDIYVLLNIIEDFDRHH